MKTTSFDKTKTMNKTGGEILINSLIAALGLFLYGFGVYLTIRANLGVGPWDAFHLGLSETLGIKYGTASIAVSLVLLAVDIALGEKIGIGMILDAFIVGKTVDLLNYLDLIPEQTGYLGGAALLLCGLFIMGMSQFLYMRSALGCGPRDSFLVGLSKRLARVPIGIVSVMIMAVVTFVGWLLGGPIGIGTLACAFLTGPIMQLEFRLVRFVPETVDHQSLVASAKVIFGKK